jgi:hypothetical protein
LFFPFSTGRQKTLISHSKVAPRTELFKPNSKFISPSPVDTHVHNLTPLGAIRQMPVEGIDYVNLMFIGPGHPLLRRKYITGKPSLPASKRPGRRKCLNARKLTHPSPVPFDLSASVPFDSSVPAMCGTLPVCFHRIFVTLFNSNEVHNARLAFLYPQDDYSGSG